MVGAKTDCGEYHVKISFGWGWVKDHVTVENLTLSSKPTSIWFIMNGGSDNNSTQ